MPNADLIQLTYDLRPEDYADFAAYHQRHSPRARRYLAVMQFLFPALWIILALLEGFPDGGWIWLVLAVLWLVFLPLFSRWSTRRRVLAFARAGLSRGCIGEHRLGIGPDGVRDTTPFNDWRVVWGGVEKVVDAPAHVFLYTGRDAACIVPKRAFAGDQEMRHFIAAAEAWQRQGATPSPPAAP